MQYIVETLPASVLNYRDSAGRTIRDYDFDPFANARMVIATKDNLCDVIDDRLPNILIKSEDQIDRYDLYTIIDEGSIRMLRYEGVELLDLDGVHVDFVSGNVKISCYYGDLESEKTVVLNNPLTPEVYNDLIRLGGGSGLQVYNGEVHSDYIHFSNCTNIPQVRHLCNTQPHPVKSLEQRVEEVVSENLLLRYRIRKSEKVLWQYIFDMEKEPTQYPIKSLIIAIAVVAAWFYFFESRQALYHGIHCGIPPRIGIELSR